MSILFFIYLYCHHLPSFLGLLAPTPCLPKQPVLIPDTQLPYWAKYVYFFYWFWSLGCEKARFRPQIDINSHRRDSRNPSLVTLCRSEDVTSNWRRLDSPPFKHKSALQPKNTLGFLKHCPTTLQLFQATSR